MTAKLQTVSASPISALYYIHYSSKFLHNFLANYHMVVASMQWAHLPRIEHKENWMICSCCKQFLDLQAAKQGLLQLE